MTNIYTDNTKLQKQPGIKPLFITSNYYCFDDTTGQGDYDLSHVSNAAIDRAAAGMAGKHPNILIDIESFDVVNDYPNAIANLQQALRRWKSADPSRMIGLYATAPERDYWTPVLLHTVRSAQWNAGEMIKRRAAYANWQQRNDRLARDLVGLMDFICPSIYAFTHVEDANWTVYAEANLLESLRIADGRPVWPIMWPLYHSGGSVDMPMWIRIVEFITTFPGINNLIAYAPDSVTLVDGWERPVLAAMT